MKCGLNRKSLLVLVVWATLELTTLASSHAGDPLRDSLGEPAQQIQKVLQSVNATSVSIGLFTPAAADQVAPYGRRIAEYLGEELKHLRVDLNENATIGVKGEYLFDSDSGKITIEFKIVDNKGRRVGIVVADSPIQAEVRDLKETLLVAHVSSDTSSIGFSAAPEQILSNHGNGESSKLVVENDFLVLPSVKIGVRLIEIDPTASLGAGVMPVNVVPIQSATAPHYLLSESKSYAIEIVNQRTDVDFAAEVFFDGINTFSLCDRDPSELTRDPLTGRENPKYQFWKISRGKKQLIPGWYKNLNQVNAFQVVPDEESVAFRLKRPAGIGTLQVLVSAAWPEGEEMSASFRKQRAKGGMGEGASMDVSLKPESLEIGIVLGSVCIQYRTK